jgi:hypothetical protein
VGPSTRYASRWSRRAAGIGTLRRPCFDFGATSPTSPSQPRSTRMTPAARSTSSRRSAINSPRRGRELLPFVELSSAPQSAPRARRCCVRREGAPQSRATAHCPGAVPRLPCRTVPLRCEGADRTPEDLRIERTATITERARRSVTVAPFAAAPASRGSSSRPARGRSPPAGRSPPPCRRPPRRLFGEGAG